MINQPTIIKFKIKILVCLGHIGIEAHFHITNQRFHSKLHNIQIIKIIERLANHTMKITTVDDKTTLKNHVIIVQKITTQKKIAF